MDAHYPASLSQHILSLIPPPPPPTARTDDNLSEHTQTAVGHSTPTSPQQPISTDTTRSIAKDAQVASTILGIPKVSIKPDIDVRKWGWPGYFTFRKSSPRKALELPFVELERSPKKSHGQDEETSAKEHVTFEIDRKALEEGLATDRPIPPVAALPHSPSEGDTTNSASLDDRPTESSPTSRPLEAATQAFPTLDARDEALVGEASPATGVVFPTTEPVESVPACPSPVPEFSISTVHLAGRYDVLDTHRRRLFYITVSVVPSTHRDVA